MGLRKVDIPVDPDVRELLRSGKGNQTWDEYLVILKKQYDEALKTAKRFKK